MRRAVLFIFGISLLIGSTGAGVRSNTVSGRDRSAGVGRSSMADEPVLQNTEWVRKSTVRGSPRFHSHPTLPVTPRAELPPDPSGDMDESALEGPLHQAFAPPALKAGYAGIAYTSFHPPDPVLAVGPSHVVLVVNSTWAAYDKTTGATVAGPFELSDWFESKIPGDFVFDPKVVYDVLEGRFVLVALFADFTAKKSAWVVSVSKTSEATGEWWLYSFDATLDGSTKSSNWADYPGLGVDKVAVYMSANMFDWDDGFAYSKVRILTKKKLYAGAKTGWRDLYDFTPGDAAGQFTVQPAHQYTGLPYNYMINAVWGDDASTLKLWKVTNPTSSKPKLEEFDVTVDSYGLTGNAAQKGGPELIHTGDLRLLNAVFRDGRIYAAHTIPKNWKSGEVPAARWYEIDVATATVVQSNTYGADKVAYYYPVIMPDAAGNIYLGFNRSSATEYAGMRFCGRRATDPAGQMSASGLLMGGKAYYVFKDQYERNRWGDYNGIGLDPSDPDSVWVYGEYAQKKVVWQTRFGRVSYDSVSTEPQRRLVPRDIRY